MKILFSLIFVMSIHFINAQPNCNVYYKVGSPCRLACEHINDALQYPQGSWQSQQGLDSLLLICPQFAYAWSQKSVPYLKRGDFANWRLYLDKAVALDPKVYLGYRAGCCFDNVKDYQQALSDIIELEHLLNSKYLGSNPSGDLNLQIIKALCYRELGAIDSSLATFKLALLIAEANNTIGSFDYFYWGATLYKQNKLTEAEELFNKQIKAYPNLAYTYYYLACIQELKNNKTQAKIFLNIAKEKYLAGNTFTEPYDINFPDQIYLRDIQKKLAALQ